MNGLPGVILQSLVLIQLSCLWVLVALLLLWWLFAQVPSAALLWQASEARRGHAVLSCDQACQRSRHEAAALGPAGPAIAAAVKQ